MFVIKNNPPHGLTKPDLWSADFNAFVNRCLTVDPQKRPSATELLNDPFIGTRENNSNIYIFIIIIISIMLSL
jgi:serine/threonine protein kinase